ncbi:hypothetical protein CcaverHIS002_0111180 [Cutaneotrichosporon cavernicola]|uniref:Rho-GAP domain-containing protein n=1 Tax=Cutaneotrichosporon cavernicola TaxID=279322 RepID=A0AA48HZF8_9TREE|nr:uncharacterized protein CcaverHIS019_0111070 [Cutaneotrichosporon cavernicola]BEI80589.1 hypothetical protein CcaverHIS002_0111180 [Cutaneotrichosporon cavernicola]BEI88389.1 hypothetical protein CcaverHIS019_0111070 [Cutaneotrichosporon cavernicola]BEI96162.1 hypothetical protein CcaverHIS631_0111110 [Cutaneotrichosporon cavernicola]BEJ03934.1 hypothetical protein CcaverHIS641_0111090 [Cutaneotrichosporon cavernicola]
MAPTAPITLPPSFFNSFWSPDYRTGLDTLFRQLEAGTIENNEVADFINAQARAHQSLAALLRESNISPGTNSTSSLQHTLMSLRNASAGRGEANRALAMELQEHILVPFNGWKARHEDRIETARDDMLGKGGLIASWEKEVNKLMGLRQAYTNKMRLADESEEDAQFAPGTASLKSPDANSNSSLAKQSGLMRSGTVADRISEKLRQASSGSHSRSSSVASQSGASPSDKDLPPPPPPVIQEEENKVEERPKSPTGSAKVAPPKLQIGGAPRAADDSPSSPTHEDAFIPPTDPNGRPKMSNEEPASAIDEHGNEFILLSGVALAPRAFRALLSRFDQYLLTHVAPGSEQAQSSELSTRQTLASRQRSSILGTYEKTFSGEELVSWLSHNLEGLGGEWDRCVDAGDELLRMGHLSRVGVVGRGFEPEDDVFFVLKVDASESSGVSVAGLRKNLSTYAKTAENYANSGYNYAASNAPAARQYANNNLSNLQTSISSFSLPAVASGPSVPTWAKNYLPAAVSSNEPAHIRLRLEANRANELYHSGVSQAEACRLDMEERIERGLRTWERWERERLGVIRSILKHYEVALAKLPKRLEQGDEATALAVETYNPESDLKALIEGSRTGPFRPRPHIYESVESEVPDVNFGIDLRRWSGETAWKSLMNAPQRAKDAIPEVLEGLLTAVGTMSADVSDDERRKAWIYEVPLEETHMLRNAINHSQLRVDEIATIAQKFNLPTVCGVVKLWLLELNPPALGWEGWEDAKAIYPSVGADLERDMTSAVRSVVGRLPTSQLFTLNAVIKHWKDLVDGTKTEEPAELYIKKLSISTGRCILRPQYETELTIQDRTPGLFLEDLLEHYSNVFPKLLEEKRNQQDRVMPVRKRTALVDQRISRSSLGGNTDSQAALLQQQRSLQADVPQQPPVPVVPSAADVGPQIPPSSGPPIQPVPVPAPITAPVPVAAVPAVPSGPSASSAVPPANFGQPRMVSPPASFSQPRMVSPPANFGPPRMISPPASDDESGPPARFVSPPESPIFHTPPLPTPAPAVIPPAPATDRPATPVRSGTPQGRGTPSPSKVDDERVGIPTSTGSLKRNTSSETSRLRGPRGARGPRAQSGHASRGSVNALAAQFEKK